MESIRMPGISLAADVSERLVRAIDLSVPCGEAVDLVGHPFPEMVLCEVDRRGSDSSSGHNSAASGTKGALPAGDALQTCRSSEESGSLPMEVTGWWRRRVRLGAGPDERELDGDRVCALETALRGFANRETKEIMTPTAGSTKEREYSRSSRCECPAMIRLLRSGDGLVRFRAQD